MDLGLEGRRVPWRDIEWRMCSAANGIFRDVKLNAKGTHRNERSQRLT